jgi:hypothetical protein
MKAIAQDRARLEQETARLVAQLTAMGAKRCFFVLCFSTYSLHWQYITEERTMRTALHLKTTVLSGGKIEIVDQELPAGELVDVIVLLAASPASVRRSAMDILAEAPGHRLFKTATDVEAYLQHEREAWER